MIVYDLNSGHREYPGYDEIEDRRGGGRGRSPVVLMGRTWSTDMGSFLLMIITVCMRR